MEQRCAFIILLTVLLNSKAVHAQTNPEEQFIKYRIDTSVLTQLKHAGKNDRLKFPGVADGFWFFSGKEDLNRYKGSKDVAKFLDTVPTFMEVVCDCAKKKDTIYLTGGIAYEGGMGFQLKIVNDLFTAYFWLSGKGRYKNIGAAAGADEIYVNARYKILKLQSRSSLKLGKTMSGALLMESEDYYDNNEPGITRMYLKLLFSCPVDEHMVL